MGWLDKLKKGVSVAKSVSEVALPIAGAVGVPGASGVSAVIDAVIKDPNDPQNVRALRQLAAEVDDLRQRVRAIEMQMQ